MNPDSWATLYVSPVSTCIWHDVCVKQRNAQKIRINRLIVIKLFHNRNKDMVGVSVPNDISFKEEKQIHLPTYQQLCAPAELCYCGLQQVMSHRVRVSITSLSLRMIKGQAGRGSHTGWAWGQRALNPHLKARNQITAHTLHSFDVTRRTKTTGTFKVTSSVVLRTLVNSSGLTAKTECLWWMISTRDSYPRETSPDYSHTKFIHFFSVAGDEARKINYSRPQPFPSIAISVHHSPIIRCYKTN
jgi:hypothetical protein